MQCNEVWYGNAYVCVYIQWGVFNGVATPREVFVVSFISILHFFPCVV